MGDTLQEAIDNYEKQVQKDVSKAIGAEVKVGFFRSGDDVLLGQNPGRGYKDLFTELDTSELESVQITDYNGNEKYNIVTEDGSDGNLFMYFTNVLRSRCRHTKQKDTGAAYFIIKTKKGIVNKLELLKLVISLREVNEFHEFCAEKLFTEIVSNPNVDACSVMLLYARRGSLDICPVRASNSVLLNAVLNNPTMYSQKAMGQ
jgi:7-cyano-7-deazaguanine reductase